MSNSDIITAFVCDWSTNMVKGNLRIVGDTLFSYAEPIAKKLGNNRVWVTDRKFSVTTSKHTGQILRALTPTGYEIMRGPKAP